MSVSEKLKQQVSWGAELRVHLPDIDPYSEGPDVLPEIVSVIEWAEKFSDVTDYHGWTDERHPRLEPELDVLLAAIEEKMEGS